ncbi:unnamed protein product [Caenorhabditis auriculariae]|uniref:EGF-like domain-containing protein n=1 Tax=Caenorhabditis auriculariae TaxID=2777116 RepID=A0A8S1HE06_9PELO|nr:unnamed protein product [Caenorhabditis auriculariae]
MLCNWTVVRLAVRLPGMKSGFGHLTGSLALAGGFHNTLSALVLCPMIFFDIETLINYSFILGHMLSLCNEIIVYTHFLISLNRFCAVFLPFAYDRIFKIKNTFCLIVAFWVLAIVTTTYFFEIGDCRVQYNPNILGLTWSRTNFCASVSWYNSFLKNAGLVFLTTVIDMFTIARLHWTNRKTRVQSHEMERRRALELSFLKQACLQSFVISADLIKYHILAPHIVNKWGKLFVGLFSWFSMFAIDGMIAIFTNKELKKAIFHTEKGKITRVAVSVIPVCVLGMACNWTIVRLAVRLPAMKSAFGNLTGSLALAAGLHNTISAFILCPTMFFGNQILIKYSFIMGHLLNMLYDIAVYTHFFISLNRLCAVFQPYHYEKIFSSKNTQVLIVSYWIFGIITTTYMFEIGNCRIQYNPRILAISWSNTEFCAFVGWYNSFLKTATLIAITASVDFLTLARVHWMNQNQICILGMLCNWTVVRLAVRLPGMKSGFGHLTGSLALAGEFCALVGWYCSFLKTATLIAITATVDLLTLFRVHWMNKNQNVLSDVMATRRARELSFLKQACLQCFVFAAELLNYHLVSTHLEGKWLKFFFSLLPWTALFTIDGIISISTNKELKKAILKKEDALKTAFGNLTGSLAAAGGLHNTFMALVTCPMIFFNFRILNTYSFILGHLLSMFHDISVFSHFFMSLNRLCAVFFPLAYENLFSAKKTKILIGAYWIFAIITTTYTFEIGDCRLKFNHELLSFGWSNTSFCSFVLWYSNFVKNAGLIVITASIDVLTVLRVHWINKDEAIESQMMATRRARELSFLKQVCLQSSVFAAELIKYYISSWGVCPSTSLSIAPPPLCAPQKTRDETPATATTRRSMAVGQAPPLPSIRYQISLSTRTTTYFFRLQPTLRNSRVHYSGGMTNAAATTRLWLGPLLLVVIIALIYLLSLMPHSPPPPMFQPSGGLTDYSQEYAMKGQIHIEWDDAKFRQNEEALFATSCQHGGLFNETDGTCLCTEWYNGDRCQFPVCMNNGVYNATLQRCLCSGNWMGEHCIFRCPHGIVNRTTGICDCGRGRACSVQKCFNGQFYDGKCICFEGYSGPACTTCEGLFCEDNMRRRGAVNSRLTLSGLSFCIITIGLLCVAARRRRTGLVPPSEDTWYRVFQPANHRPFRCRHDYFCGGSWMPRDRALIVAPGRVSLSSASSNGRPSTRSQRLAATPPPSYTSVDNLTRVEEQMPPTYEEATRTLSEEPEDVVEVIDETDVNKDENSNEPHPDHSPTNNDSSV